MTSGARDRHARQQARQTPEGITKGTLLGTPNWEPQEYSRNIIYLLYSWGSPFGVPSRVPLITGVGPDETISLNSTGKVRDDLLSRLARGIHAATLWLIGVMGILTKPPYDLENSAPHISPQSYT